MDINFILTEGQIESLCEVVGKKVDELEEFEICELLDRAIDEFVVNNS